MGNETLKDKEGISFRWHKRGKRLINTRAKANKMSKKGYLCWLVEREAEDARRVKGIK